jgi:oligopeptide/dipeptide ABC transporter ATP-binding protein
MVMYAGEIMERAPAGPLFKTPQHPYTQGLLRSMPRLDEHRSNRLQTIGGQPPNLQHLPDGCRFRDRCGYAFDRCAAEKPLLRTIAEARAKACHLEAI